MTLEVVKTVAITLSSAFAGASVLRAAYVYKSEREQRKYVDIRQSLQQILATQKRIDSQLSDLSVTELADKVSIRLEELIDLSASLDDLEKFFLNAQNQNFVKRAIALGRIECVATDELNQSVIDMEREPGEIRAAFPVLFETLSTLTQFTAWAARYYSSTNVYFDVLSSEENWRGAIRDSLEEETDVADPVLRFKMLMTMIPSAFLGELQALLDAIVNLMRTLVDRYCEMSDAQLRKQSRLESRLVPEVEEVDFTSSVDDVLGYLTLLKSNALKDIWQDVRRATQELKGAYLQFDESDVPHAT